jgi:hypothetical protein
MAPDEGRKGGRPPADKSLINRRLKAHPVPVQSIERRRPATEAQGG